MTKEYIERGAAVELCSQQYKECLRKNDWCSDTVAWNIGFGIKQLPAADVVEVKHGRWKSVGLAGLKCSKCGNEDHWKMYYSYCPNCGAKMDLEV